jgi:hypothetical protein
MTPDLNQIDLVARDLEVTVDEPALACELSRGMRMRRLWFELAALAVLTPLACASVQVERRDYILAHPHGWVEVTIEDLAVPLVPPDEDSESKEWTAPYACGVEIHLDREPFVDAWAYPTGEVAPFAVRTGFRFPAPLGTQTLRVAYGSCRIEAGVPATVDLELPIQVEEGRVSEVRFDGSRLTALPIRDDAVVTLEDIYEAVRGAPQPAP